MEKNIENKKENNDTPDNEILEISPKKDKELFSKVFELECLDVEVESCLSIANTMMNDLYNEIFSKDSKQFKINDFAEFIYNYERNQNKLIVAKEYINQSECIVEKSKKITHDLFDFSKTI